MDSVPWPALFAISSAVRGYHVYHDIWDVLIGEELPCQWEADNFADSFDVAVVKSGNIVGHVPSVTDCIIIMYDCVYCRLRIPVILWLCTVCYNKNC